jgi:hypothetical protein
VGKRLEVLHVTKTASEEIDERVLKHIAKCNIKASLHNYEIS